MRQIFKFMVSLHFFHSPLFPQGFIPLPPSGIYLSTCPALLPVMYSNPNNINSNHMLSLPSVLFKSNSTSDSQGTKQTSKKPFWPQYAVTATSTTTSALPKIQEDSHIDEPDESITALPPSCKKSPNKLVRRQQSQSSANPSGNSPNESPSEPWNKLNKSPSHKKSKWASFIKKIKGPFQVLKVKKRVKIKAETEPKTATPEMVISPPTKFRHVGGPEILAEQMLRKGNDNKKQVAREGETVETTGDDHESDWEDCEEYVYL